VVEGLAAHDPRITAVRHDRNRGKGAAIRTAIDHAGGDVVVIQDADLEYNPRDFAALLEPITSGRADAVFGSRFSGRARRVLFFWHSVGNRFLTLVANMLTDLNLSDMETGYKMVRTDVLRQLRLQSNTFTIEPELTSRLAQWGARIYEVPISYAGRTYQEGKKIRPRDGLKAVGQLLRTHLWDTQFTSHVGFYVLSSMSKATRFNRWLLDQVRPFLGDRLLEAGAGIGNLSGLLLNRERLVLLEREPIYLARLARRFDGRRNVRVVAADLADATSYADLADEEIDTIWCSNVLEHIGPDEDVLASFAQLVVERGHCIVVVPASRHWFNRLDAALEHLRRYEADELRRKLENAGFEVVLLKRFNRLGAIGWLVSGWLGRQRLSPAQMIWFDRLLPLARFSERVLPVPGLSLIAVGRKRARPVSTAPVPAAVTRPR
jgi:glycosyltransferase involved in cell wall biosynthesis